MFSGRVFIPLYAAASDGIYRLNRGKRVLNFGKVVIAFIGILLLFFLILFGAFALYFGFISTKYPIILSVSLAIGIPAIAGGAYGIIKLVKFITSVKVNYTEGELIIPWSQVKSIVVANVRSENVSNSPILMPVYKKIGDWHIMTNNGSEIVIPYVDDPVKQA